MLITCKCTPLCKKLDCDAKIEPPYLATTYPHARARNNGGKVYHVQ
jgi:hypothetical protein